MVNVKRVIEVLESLIKVPVYLTLGLARDRVIYYSNVEGVSSLWSMNTKGRDRRSLAKEINNVLPIVPESSYVVYTRDVARGMEQHRLYYVDSQGGEEKLVSDTPPMRIIGGGFDGKTVVFTGVSGDEIGLFKADLGGSWEKLTRLDVFAYVTSFDGRYVVGEGNLKKNPRSYELFIYDMKTNELQIYTPKEGSQNKSPVAKDGKILFESNFEGKNRLYIYDPEEKSLSKVEFRYRDYSEYDPVENVSFNWTSDGRIWVVGKKNGRCKLFLDGKEIKTPQGTINGYPVFIGKDRVLVTVSSLLQPTRIIEVDVRKNKHRVVVDNKIPSNVGKDIGRVEFVKYRSFDNLEIPMYVIISSNAGKPGPTVVYVHGGPWAEIDDSWSPLMASLAVLGYHVLAPNYRGSTGYGEEFRLLDIGDPGGGDLEDIVHAVKWAVENKLADKEKVAIMGYSYGGFMTYLALGKYPEIWRCGVAGAGVVDWEEMYSLSDALFKQFIDILFAGKKDLFKERSPITYVEKVSKPICILHPQNDTRTPLKPVLRYISLLLENKKSFEVHIVPDMGHVIVRLDDAVKMLLPALLFLEKNMK